MWTFVVILNVSCAGVCSPWHGGCAASTASPERATAVATFMATPPATTAKSVHHAVGDPAATNDSVIRVTVIGKAPQHMNGAQARLMARRAGEVLVHLRLAGITGAPQGHGARGVRFVSYGDRPDGSCVVTGELRPR